MPDEHRLPSENGRRIYHYRRIGDWVSDQTPQLTNGWSLTSLTATADSKASEMVTAIGNLTGNVAKAATGQMLAAGKQFGPGLYRIVFTKGFVTDLELIFLQGEASDNPAKCKELKPPGQS